MLRRKVLFFCLVTSFEVSAASAQVYTGPHSGGRAGRDLSGSLAAQERYDLIPIDTLFYIENRGLSRILADLNGHRFKLVSDPDEIGRSANAFLIPEFGRITINIAQYMRDEGDNYIEIEPRGPPGTDAFLLIGDLLVPGEDVEYAITDLADLPGEIGLLEGYPNPFRDRVTLAFDLPESWIDGMPVFIAVYDVLGRRIEVLVDDRRYPGSFTVDWMPRGDAASGVYFCRMTAGGRSYTVRLVYTR